MQSRGQPFVDGSGLAWNALGGAAETAAPAAKTNSSAPEAMVAIPRDSDSLRFTIPSGGEPAAAAPQEPAPPQVATNTREEGVVRASYTEPALEYTEPVLARTQPAPNPWRQPRLAEAALPPPPPVVQLFVPQPATQVASLSNDAVPNRMDVRMRAVASPPPESGPTPRIRFSADAVPQTASADGFRPRSPMR
jgi:hypothetical protein